jgi:hypothetical protein
MSARRSARKNKGKSPSRLGDGDGWASGAARDWTGDAADTPNNGAQANDSDASSRAPSSTSKPKNKNVRHHIVAPLLVLQTRVLFWPADGMCGDLVFVFDALLCCVVAPRRGSKQLSLHNRVTDSLATDFQFLISNLCNFIPCSHPQESCCLGPPPSAIPHPPPLLSAFTPLLMVSLDLGQAPPWLPRAHRVVHAVDKPTIQTLFLPIF